MVALHRRTTGSKSMPALGVRAYGTAAVIALLLLSAPASLIAQSAATSGQHDPRDIRITLKARQALSLDTELCRLPVSVTVRQGKVTLWGQVPSDALARRAARIVEQVPGVFHVKSDLVIGPVEPVHDDDSRLSQSIAAPVPNEPPHRRDPRSPGVLAGHERPTTPARQAAAEMRLPIPHSPTATETAAPAILLAPRALEQTKSLQSVVERVIQSDVRFSGMRCQESAGKITLTGSAARMEHVMDLSKQVARLPGVKEVVVESLRLQSR
jgi:osmotically-inducible protein OsmY